jgi:polysaccharide biosynthesis protein PslH
LDRLIQSEISHLAGIKVLVHCSVDDFNFFQQHLPHAHHVLAMPTISESLVSSVKAAGESSADRIDLLFVGQSTEANCSAMKWFFEEVWPLIADHGYTIKIVGQIGVKVRESLPEIYQAHRASFTGSSGELAPYYRAARCVIAPMVSGTGISIKTIEALAMGKPFVGTSKAFRGMPTDRIKRLGLQAHDTAQEFASAIVRAMSDEDRAGQVSRDAYEGLFSTKMAYESREEALSLATSS